jgi:hypothetical protein
MSTAGVRMGSLLLNESTRRPLREVVFHKMGALVSRWFLAILGTPD